MRDVNFSKNDNVIISKKVILSNATHNYLTKHFTIYWGDKNPATTLWADYNGDSIPDFITNTAEILENVWNREVDEFGFNPPKYDHINVYVSDTGLYLDGNELTLDDSVCGYAVYTGDEEYIVVNATPPSSYNTSSMDMLKITLAHEFFHLIQYGYSLNFKNVNLWLYEGTAVLMEHLVYPEIPDYIDSYVYQIFDYPNIGLMDYNGLFVYVSVIFFDYLENKYGIDVIKNIWQTFDSENNSLNAINDVLKDYNTTINKELYSFYYDLEHNLSAFSNSDLLSYYGFSKDSVTCDYIKNDIILPTGAFFVDSQCNRVSFINYDVNLTTLSSQNNNVFAYNTDDFVVSFAKDLNMDDLYYDTIYYMSANQEIDLTNGWNLVTFKHDTNISGMDFDVLWVYRNGKWFGYSNDEDIKNYLISGDMFTDEVYSNEGVWIYTQSDSYVDVKLQSGGVEYNLSNGWNLVSFPSYFDVNLSVFSDVYGVKQIWIYNNGWSFYSNDEELVNTAKSYSIPIVDSVNANGFWVLKN